MAFGLPTRYLAALAPAAVFLAVYVPRVGHGFILDDYRWVLESRVGGLSDVLLLFSQNNGFFRPIVSLTFAADHAIFGLEPFWYGLTNVGLALSCAGLIYGLGRTLRMPWGGAAFAASTWLLNFHGVNMAVLWISGRTALILTLAAVAAAILVLRQRLLLAAVCVGVALLAKEEAIVLPAILGAWLYIFGRVDGSRRTRILWIWVVYSVVLVTAYLLLRENSGAMTPSTAPTYYRFTFEPGALGRNALEYGDRTFTFPLILVGLAWLCLRWRDGPKTWPMGVRPHLVACAVGWTLGAYALTIFLPVRSSLYVCFPLVGSSLIAAELCSGYWRTASSRAHAFALRASLACTLVAAPIHYSRTHRLVDQAEVARAAWTALPNLTRDVPDGATVAIYDDVTRRANVRSAFGNLTAPAYELLTGRRLNFWLEPPVEGAGSPPCSTCVARQLAFRDGALVIVPDQE